MTSNSIRIARNRRQNQRRALKAQGMWDPWVDADIVRKHMASLREQGVTLKRIAELSDTPRGEINSITYGTGRTHIRKVRTEIATRILAVRPIWHGIPDEAFMPTTGLARRLQALVAIGWPPPVLAERLGIHLTYLNKILRGAHPRVTGRFHRIVEGLYDELWNVDPITADVPAALISRAKSRAAGHNWAPPAAWDDELIDDPTAQPSVCDDTPRYVAHAENCLELERQGHTRAQIAERLGVTRDGLQRALSLYRKNILAGSDMRKAA
ncbi:hypothetical protein [Streptomyces sp. H27-H5]|uniref:hypothetical protein n=1 Tax=Streptomyces sp. H27-H5 TaxID=2996460 RepID=UPI0022719140|nr:hypothetical protein [Streptomyces sp. H27-H5]MCY0959933.1 hypothetical protein [Streptomyces sp. H27-H5]